MRLRLLPLLLAAVLPAAADQTQTIDQQIPIPVPEVPPAAAMTSFIEVVFVLDTTGSMGSLIEGAKQKIWSIANTMASALPPPEIRMGLVAYRDRGDTYVTRLSPLTDDLDSFYATLMQLVAAGGGDAPESVNQALHEAITRFDWSDDRTTLKLVYLVGDAPPHMDYANDVKYPESCALARDADIFINTVQCGGMKRTGPFWRDIASGAGGEFFAIAQSGGMQVISTPYDSKLAAHSKLLDGTFVGYGTDEQQAGQNAKLEMGREIDKNASMYANASRAKYKASKAGEKSFSGGQELIGDIESSKIKLEELPEDQLPPRMQKMTPEERVQFVADQAARRKGLREEIAFFHAKRKEFLAQQTAGDENSFDQRVIQALTRQAATKGIAYKPE